MASTILLIGFQTHCQELERPFILVKSSERNQVLQKIETESWAKDIYTELKEKTDKQVNKFFQNPNKYIKQLPFNWKEGAKNKFPPFFKTDHIENGKLMRTAEKTDFKLIENDISNMGIKSKIDIFQLD